MGLHGIKPTVTTYLTQSRPGHPVAHADWRVRVHRANLYDAIGPGPHSCHWCGCQVDWFEGTELHADHLDGNTWNNDISNLVASCPVCNRKRAPRRPPRKATHCTHGHEFTPENSAIRASGVDKGKRSCRACQKASWQRYRAKKRAQRIAKATGAQ